MRETAQQSEQFKCPGWLYRFGANVLYYYLKWFFGMKLDREEVKDLKGPFLVVANHQSLNDFGVVAKACIQTQLHFVISSHFFHNPLYHKLFNFIGAISKRQFAPDPVSVRKMLRVARRGESICIFPEGQTCYSGENPAVDPGIGRLAKLLKLPVINVQIRGNYLRRPKWARGKTYPSACEAKASLLLTKEQVEALSDEQLAQIITAGIAYDEFEWQRKKMLLSKRHRTAEGLESILYACPACESELTLETSGRHLRCTHCGYDVILNDYCFFESACDMPLIVDTISGWMRWQSDLVKHQLDEGTLLPLSSHGRYLESDLGDYEEFGYHCYGEGTGTIDENGFTFVGTRDGEPYTYTINPNGMWDITHNADLASISLNGGCVGNKDYAFDPDEPRLLMKYVLAWPHMRDKYFPSA